jgi:hypothetical protein
MVAATTTTPTKVFARGLLTLNAKYTRSRTFYWSTLNTLVCADLGALPDTGFQHACILVLMTCTYPPPHTLFNITIFPTQLFNMHVSSSSHDMHIPSSPHTFQHTQYLRQDSTCSAFLEAFSEKKKKITSSLYSGFVRVSIQGHWVRLWSILSEKKKRK